MTDEPSTTSERSGLKSIVALVWVVFFVFAFFRWGPTHPLPGPSGVELTRTDFLTIDDAGSPFSLLASNLIDNLFGGVDPKTEGWRFFQWQLVLRAIALVIGMIAMGRLLLRLFRVPLTPRLEANVFGFGLGASALSLFVLLTGLGGFLDWRIYVGVVGCSVLIELTCSVLMRSPAANVGTQSASKNLIATCVILVTPMLLMIVLGALSPPTDFDVREYHLQGPKEYFQNGQITFLPHNAYTSFPFLTEMLSLLGMTVMGDWYTGALLGKLLLAAFAPMTALALIAAGRRCFDSRAGWLAAVVFLTAPWVYRISIIAYAEGGLTFFLLASLLAVARFAREKTGPNVLLCGLLCGSAMACKYPALLSVVAPVGVAVLYFASRRSEEEHRVTVVKAGLLFAVGVVIAVGPWLVKNLVETGNPVYPLAYSVFGGEDWTPEIQARWKAGHSPPNHKLSDLTSRVVDVTVRSTWMSPLLFALAPLALLVPRDWRRGAVGFWLFVLWMFGSWWVFTHRIDRFWVPMIPIVALLAGVGLSAIRHPIAKYGLLLVLACGTLFNTVFASSPWSGYNVWLRDPVQARQLTEKQAATLLVAEDLNNRDTKSGRILCVGEAAVFEARSDVIYNTVFDLNIFQDICGQSVSGGPDADVALLPSEECRTRLRDRNVRYIIVNWLEVLRYRAPGSYGFTEFVRRENFDALVQSGVLSRVHEVYGKWERLSEHDRTIVAGWGSRRDDTFVAQEIYRVEW